MRAAFERGAVALRSIGGRSQALGAQVAGLSACEKLEKAGQDIQDAAKDAKK